MSIGRQDGNSFLPYHEWEISEEMTGLWRAEPATSFSAQPWTRLVIGMSVAQLEGECVCVCAKEGADGVNEQEERERGCQEQ